MQVEVTDRMPPKTGRVIDLSERAAEHVGMKESGTAPVKVEAKRPDSAEPLGLRTSESFTAPWER